MIGGIKSGFIGCRSRGGNRKERKRDLLTLFLISLYRGRRRRIRTKARRKHKSNKTIRDMLEIVISSLRSSSFLRKIWRGPLLVPYSVICLETIRYYLVPYR